MVSGVVPGLCFNIKRTSEHYLLKTMVVCRGLYLVLTSSNQDLAVSKDYDHKLFFSFLNIQHISQIFNIVQARWFSCL